MNFVAETHLCGGVTSAFVLCDSHFSPPCVGVSFIRSRSAGMRVESPWGVR